MKSFSERFELRPPRPVQLTSMDDALRNGLWNAIHTIFFAPRLHWVRPDTQASDSVLSEFITSLAAETVKVRLDSLPIYWSGRLKPVRDHFMTATWSGVYEFLESAIQLVPQADRGRIPSFVHECNRILERELSGYRFVGAQLVRITDDAELSTIEEARRQPTGLQVVQQHLDTALRHLSDRESPDFRNSIKESISAVESFCSLVAGNSKADLDVALRKLEEKMPLHPALKKAFKQLYGYSSDAKGIRHALLEEADLSFDDAKFMLVACAAFINYLKGQAARGQLSLV